MDIQTNQATTVDVNKIATALELPNPTPEQQLITKWENRGEQDGCKIAEFDMSQSVQRMGFIRATLMAAAKELEGKELFVREYLSGLRKVFKGQKGEETRISEARTILIACAKEPERLQGFEGTYQDFVSVARQVKTGKEPKQVTTKAEHRITKVTDKGMPKLEERVKVLTVKQAETIANLAQEQIVRASKQWESALVSAIYGLANRLKQSTQPLYQNFGADLIDMCAENQAYEQAEAAKTKAAIEEHKGKELPSEQVVADKMQGIEIPESAELTESEEHMLEDFVEAEHVGETEIEKVA